MSASMREEPRQERAINSLLSVGDEPSEPETLTEFWPSPRVVTLGQPEGPEGERGEAAPPSALPCLFVTTAFEGEREGRTWSPSAWNATVVRRLYVPASFDRTKPYATKITLRYEVILKIMLTDTV